MSKVEILSKNMSFLNEYSKIIGNLIIYFSLTEIDLEKIQMYESKIAAHSIK